MRTAPKPAPYLHAPAITEYAEHDPAGVSILPEGKLLHPVGRSLPLARWPNGLAISPDEATVFIASRGAAQTVTDWRGDAPQRKPFPLADDSDSSSTRRTDAGACTFSRDGKTIFWSGGENGRVYLFDAATHAFLGDVSLNAESSGRKWADSYAMDLALSADGATLYCADVTNFRVAAIDVAQRKVVASVPVGRYPYALAVSGNHVFVANIGMFEYNKIAPPAPDDKDEKDDKRGLTFPAYGTPSKEAREGVDVEGRHVPGLGDPNAARVVLGLGDRRDGPGEVDGRPEDQDGPAGRLSLDRGLHGRRQRAQLSRCARRRPVRFR